MIDAAKLAALAQTQTGCDAAPVDVEMRPLAGGLEASSVGLVTAMVLGSAVRFIAKHVEGRAVREAAVYRHLAKAAPVLAARVLSIEHAPDGCCTLYLEALRAPVLWPWRDLKTAAQVLERAAALHETARVEDLEAIPVWDYDAELLDRGRECVELLASSGKDGVLAPLRRFLPALRRLVATLPAWREHLLSAATLPRCLVHGDLHTGNVLFREDERGATPVLIDWGRAREGSPLEDVSSWLQSLGYWEPAAKRKHDTLLKSYLAARGLRPRLTEELRTAYWLAGGSNALAGALQHHLTVAVSTSEGAIRDEALGAARDWLRIVRRADARWSEAISRGRRGEFGRRIERSSSLRRATRPP